MIGCASGDDAPSEGAQPGPDAGSTLGRKSIVGALLPCEVQEVLETSCQSCHSREPGAIAPMALVTQADFVAPAISDAERPVHELAAMRIHDRERPMPPPSSRRLTDEELAVLDAFFAGGAPPAQAEDGCGNLPDAGPPEPEPPPDDLGECYRFQAHDKQEPGDTTPFQLENGESYGCFFFAVPWPEGSQAVSLRSLDTQHTHHWQIYHTVEEYTDGQIKRGGSSCGYDLREVLGVYSHGESREHRFPDDVGLQLPPPTPEHGLLLEVHFYNPGDTVADTTGVEICTARQPREHEAGVAVIGASIFTLPPGQRTTVTGTCTPAYEGQIHIFQSFPHMHSRGYRMDTIIARADGRREQLFDVPFDFNRQIMYDTPAVLDPGDQLIINCHYQNDTGMPIRAGFGVDDEMCNHFVYAWPPATLSNANFDQVAGLCLF